MQIFSAVSLDLSAKTNKKGRNLWRSRRKCLFLPMIFALKRKVMDTLAINNFTVTPLEALWALFKSQPKPVRKAFVKKLIEEDVESATLRQQLEVKQSLTQAFRELKAAEKSNSELPNARDLFR